MHPRSPARHIPSAISLSRGVAGALLLAVESGTSLLVLLAWGAVSDFLDGFLSRRFRWTSSVGATIDICADGLFFLAALVALWLRAALPSHWFVLVVLFGLLQVACQAIVWARGGTVGSLGHPLDKALGAYSYFLVLALPLGLDADLVCAGQVAMQLAANGRDLWQLLARRERAHVP